MSNIFKSQLVLLFISLFINQSIAQNNSASPIQSIEDTLPKTKSGFSFGGSPILAFDSDLGIRYGATINIFDYGNGSTYPKYLQYIRLKISNSTKKTTNLSLLYDTEKLFNNTRVVSELSYIRDVALNYLGYNGKNTNYIDDLVNPESNQYVNKYFYNHQRKWIRARFDIHKNILIPGLSLYAGITYNNISTEAVTNQALDIPKGTDGYQPNSESLYSNYKAWGVIPENETNGGLVYHGSLGFSYDTRNNQLNCNKGIFLETYMLMAPKLGLNNDFTKHIFTFRQYLKIPKTDFVFFYRISSQQKLWGTTPYFYLPVFFDSQMNQDGIGGAFNLRGITRNRVVSEGFVLGNFELRKCFFQFSLLKLNFDIDLSIFSDASFITQEYNANYDKIPEDYRSQLINDNYEKAYLTYGAGLYIIYNVNNVISVNYGISNDDQLGKYGLYVGSSFLF